MELRLDELPLGDWEDNSMDIYSPDGTKVIFTANGGRDYEIERAKQVLTIGSTYTVEHTEVHAWYTDVYLYEHPALKFNSVMFVNSDEYAKAVR